MGLLTNNNKSIEVRMSDLIAGDIMVSSTNISNNLFDGLRWSSPNEYRETQGRMTKAQWKNAIDDLEGVLHNTMKEGFRRALALLEDSLDERVKNSVFKKLIGFLEGEDYKEENDIFINTGDPTYINWDQIGLDRAYSDKLSGYFNTYMLENFEKNVLELNLKSIYRVSTLNHIRDWGVNDNNFITIARRTFSIDPRIRSAMLWPVVVEMDFAYGKVYYNLFNIKGMVSINNLMR